MEYRVFLIGCDLYNSDDAAIIKGYIFGTEDDAEAYCAKLNQDSNMGFEWEELDCLNPEKLSAFINHKSISSDIGQ